MFQVCRLNERLIRIEDVMHDYMYLLIGDNQAMLIDCGFGYGDLMPLIREYTDLPVILCLTHGHLDHAGGISEFNDVYLGEADWPLLGEHNSIENRARFAAFKLSPRQCQDIKPCVVHDLHPLVDGQCFDLGRVNVCAHALPGHTCGMMAFEFMDKLLLSDGCSSLTLLLTSDVKLSEYQNTLKELLKRGLENHEVLFSHPGNKGGYEVIAGNIELCQRIMNHQDEHVKKFISLYSKDPIYAAKEVDVRMQPCDGSSANIFYQPHNL